MRHLDTNIVIAYLNGNTFVADRLRQNLPDVGMSSVVLAELLYGARASTRATQNLAAVRQLLQVVSLASFDEASAEAYSEIRFSLRRKGRPTGEVDALIAAVAIANNAVLVTHNTRHFESVDRLILEDWLA